MSKVRFLGEPRSFHWGHHSVREMGPLKKLPQVTDWQWMFQAGCSIATIRMPSLATRRFKARSTRSRQRSSSYSWPWSAYSSPWVSIVRAKRVISREVPANGFNLENSNLSPFMQRLARAHANSLEDLPVAMTELFE